MFSIANYIGTKEVGCVFFEIKKEHPEFDRVKSIITAMHGIEIDDPNDSTYELRIPRSIDTCKGFEVGKVANMDINDHIFLRINNEVVQYGTRLKVTD